MVYARNVGHTATEIVKQINVEIPSPEGIYTGRQPGY
jgi:hypothetical protein